MTRSNQLSLEILREVASHRDERRKFALSLIARPPAVALSDILIADGASEARLLETVGDIQAIVSATAATRHVTDWPFEHFWENPNETRHSRLIGYFINPKSEHTFGRTLLQSFLRAIKLFDENLPVDGKRQPGYMTVGC